HRARASAVSPRLGGRARPRGSETSARILATYAVFHILSVLTPRKATGSCSQSARHRLLSFVAGPRLQRCVRRPVFAAACGGFVRRGQPDLAAATVIFAFAPLAVVAIATSGRREANDGR